MMAEHSYADALTVGHMWEWVTTEERMNGGIYMYIYMYIYI
jgi:hypothetical protein